MIRYGYGETLVLLKEREELADGDAGITIMKPEEFRERMGKRPGGRALVKTVQNIQYCKAEVFGTCVIGTFVIPDKDHLLGEKAGFGFCLENRELTLVDEGTYAKRILEQMRMARYGENIGVGSFLLLLMDYIINDDVLFLQKYEEGLAAVEEELLDHLPPDFYQTVIRFRKELMILHSYYEQLVSLGEELEANDNHIFGGGECEGFGIFASRASRLHDHVEMLREYVLQIREMYQSQIDVRQNQIMSWLTVVTTLFLPLSILVGWYGMNFVNMPELQWKYGYLAMIIVGAASIVIEICFFKKKKLL